MLFFCRNWSCRNIFASFQSYCAALAYFEKFVLLLNAHKKTEAVLEKLCRYLHALATHDKAQIQVMQLKIK